MKEYTRTQFRSVAKRAGIDMSLMEMGRTYDGRVRLEAKPVNDSPLEIRRANKAVTSLMEAVTGSDHYGTKSGWGGWMLTTGSEPYARTLARENRD